MQPFGIGGGALLCLPSFLRFVPSVCACVSHPSLSVLVPFYLLYHFSLTLSLSRSRHGAGQTIGVRVTEQTSDLPILITI